MKQLFTGLAAIATCLTTLAQPDCAQVIQTSFTSSTQGDIVVVTNTSDAQFPQLTTYQWSFGDGTVTDGANVTHLYGAPGTYTICLFAQVYDGNVLICADSTCQQVVIGGEENPCDGLNAEFTHAVDGNEVQFSNVVSSNLYAYQWYFGDGTEGFGPDPAHAYPVPGTYTVCLVMWTWDPFLQDTCWADNCELVGVQGGSPCDSTFACFQWSLQNNTAQFFNCSGSNGQDLNYWWSFGDGTNGDGYQPTHTYPVPGTYNVCLTAYTDNSPDSCSNTICNTLVIQGGNSTCDSLSADFVVTVQENVASFNAFGGTAIAYQWYFGDGTQGDASSTTHTYAEPGTYNACLVTWTWDPQTQDTCYAEHCQWVTIGGGSPCDSTFACFQWGLQNNTAQFFNCSGSNGQDLNYWWSFGDGTNGDGYQPTHTYPGPGTYNVCLTAYTNNSPDSCSSTICNTLVIQGDGSPCDSLSADFIVTVQENLASFNGFGGSAIAYQWYFGDGTQGNGPSTTHTYPGPGTYNACLVTWSWDPQTQDTCYAEHCEPVIVGGGDPCDGLQAGFFADPFPFGAQFSNSTTGTGFQTTWSWTFGDGTTSGDPQPQHAYQESGWYLVCLTAISVFEQQGGGLLTCVDTTCQEVFIPAQGGSPCDSLNADFAFTTSQNTASFNVLDPTASGYEWFFGDGSSGGGISPVHTYAQSGTYQVCLIVWSWDPQTQDTCYADHCEFVIVGGGGDPCDGLQAGFQAIVGDATVWFSNATTGTGFQTTWNWDFGDGTTSADAQPSHVFPGLGTYEVCLTVTTMFEQQGGGVITCTDTYCAPVSNNGGSPCDSLEAHFVWEPGGPNVFQFQDASFTGGQGVWYQWSFGDGQTSDLPDPTHTFSEPGEYTVCLTIIAFDQPDSCTSTVCQTINVQGGGSPCDDLNAEFSANVTGNAVSLLAGMNPPGTTFDWIFGDGTFGTGPSAAHVFPAPGTYNVCLTVGNYDPVTQDSCFEDHCMMITIFQGGSPCDSLWNPSFEFDQQGNVFTFFNTSNTQGAEVTTHWSFGDGATGGDAQITHTYGQGGEYLVCMTITGFIPGTNDTCQVTVCQTIDVALGVDDRDGASTLNVWPQPFDELFQVEGRELWGMTRFTLLDMTGRVIDERTINAQGRVALGYSGLPPGTYLLRVLNERMDRSVRLMKR